MCIVKPFLNWSRTKKKYKHLIIGDWLLSYKGLGRSGVDYISPFFDMVWTLGKKHDAKIPLLERIKYNLFLPDTVEYGIHSLLKPHLALKHFKYVFPILTHKKDFICIGDWSGSYTQSLASKSVIILDYEITTLCESKPDFITKGISNGRIKVPDTGRKIIKQVKRTIKV